MALTVGINSIYFLQLDNIDNLLRTSEIKKEDWQQ